MPDRGPSPVTLDDLDRVIRDPDLMPPGTQIQPLGPREYRLLSPGNPFFTARSCFRTRRGRVAA